MIRTITGTAAAWLAAIGLACGALPAAAQPGGAAPDQAPAGETAGETADARPVPFRATYDARIGVARGRVEMTLLPEAGAATDRFAYRSVTRPRGMARLIRSAPLIECTVFRVTDNGAWLASEHQYIDGEPGEGKSSSAVFDRDAGVAHARYRDRDAELPVTETVYDRMLEQLIVSRDLAAGRAPGPYRIVQRAELQTITYERIGEARVDTDAGEFQTVVYRRQREGSSRSALTWFAPALGWLPVQTEQFKGEDRQARVRLSAVERPAAGTLAVRQARGSVTPLCP